MKALVDLGYANVSGIDISEEQVQFARNKFGLRNVEVADAFGYLAQKKDEYVTIMLLDVIEHVETQKSIELVSLARAALKNGGKLILQAPNGLSPLSINYWGDITHQRAYSIKSMDQTLLMGGFRQFSHFSCPPPICSIKSLFLSISWRFFISPLIKVFLYASYGTNGGGIYTPNLLTVAYKENIARQSTTG